jgi:hypothetical protein
MYKARNKQDLIIEVWEALDCESVGALEIIAIEKAVVERYGESAVDSPMSIARQLADEGAVLRHSEIMELWVERASDRPYDPVLRNIIDLGSFAACRQSINRLENARRRFAGDGDKDGIRLLTETALSYKENAIARAHNPAMTERDREMAAEMAEWLTIWLRTPGIFQTWVELRERSEDFRARFSQSEQSDDDA